jgi:hypothetical protein
VSARTFSFWAALLLAPCVPASAIADDSNLVVLPAYDVKGIRPWLYAEIPGYQILSLASEKDTRTVLEKIQRAARFTPLFFPSRAATSFTARSTLFLHHFAGERTVDDAARRLQLSFKPRAFTVSAGDSFVEFPTSERLADWLAGKQLPSTFFSVSELVLPRIPVWYREGLSTLLSAAHASDSYIQTHPLNWQRTPVMPLRNLLAVEREEQFQALNATPRNLSAFRTGALLFAHWAYLGDKGRRRAALLDFVNGASEHSANETLFRRCFGMGYDEAQSVLDEYARKQAWRPGRIPLPKTRAPEKAAAIVVRPATPGEVARVVGESYLLLADTAAGADAARYRQKARSVLEGAYHGGDRDARLLAQLGFLEISDQHWDQARDYLESSAALNVPLPRAYLNLALLRLAKCGAAIGDTTALTEQQCRDVLAPTLTALSLQPPLADAYALAADIFKRGVIRPTSEQLILLSAVAQHYPRNIPLIANVTLVEVREQRYDVARRLVAHVLESPELPPSVRSAFITLRDKIPAQP